MSQDAQSAAPVFDEIVDSNENGAKYVGQCKWFSDKLGYGFLTICDGEKKGLDIFSHHSGIKPLNSNYKTLKKGEYVEFNIVNGMNGLQAVNVTGINGGALMCDFVTLRKPISQGEEEVVRKPRQGEDGEGWQQVNKKQVLPPPKKSKAKYNKNAAPRT